MVQKIRYNRQTQINKHFQSTPFLTYFLKFCYIFLLIPYRLKLNRVRVHLDGDITCYYSVSKCNLSKKLVCFLYFLSGLFWHLHGVRTAINFFGKTNDPSNYFVVCQKIIGSCAKLWAQKVIWCNGKDIVCILNHVLHSPQKYRKQNANVTVALVICVMYTMITISDFVFLRGLGKNGASININHSRRNFTSSAWWDALVCEGYANFWLDPPDPPEGCGINWKNILIGGFSMVGLLNRRFIGSFLDLFLLMTALTLWSTVKSFAERFKDSQTFGNSSMSLPIGITIEPKAIGWNEVYQEYMYIRHLSDLINKVAGKLVTLFLLSGILDYAVGIDELISNTGWRNWSNVAGEVFYVCYTIAFLCFSAECSHQVCAHSYK